MSESVENTQQSDLETGGGSEPIGEQQTTMEERGDEAQESADSDQRALEDHQQTSEEHQPHQSSEEQSTSEEQVTADDRSSEIQQNQDHPLADQNGTSEKKPTKSVAKASKVPPRVPKQHRGPPEPSEEELATLEKRFLLDCIAVNRIASDYSNCQPKRENCIPAYNSQKDRHVEAYFNRVQVSGTLRKTSQDQGGCSIAGPVIDKCHQDGPGQRYLYSRNETPGAAQGGHSIDQISGHDLFLSNARPHVGPNGEFGYRRNSPWLRNMPSQFGTDPLSPTH